MDLLHLDELKNLQELRHLNKLDDLNSLQKMEQLQHMDKLEYLQQLPQLQHMDQLQHIESLDKLQSLNQLQHLDKLSALKALGNLQNLNLLNNMQSLQQLHYLDRLQQLHMLNRMDALEKLNQLQNMKVLKNLSQMQSLNELPQLSNLHYMENLHELNNLHRLQQLDVLNRLRIVDRLLNFNFTTLLYLFSLVVPGLIFLETIALLVHAKLGIRRSLALMVIYNVLNLLLCLLFGFEWIARLSSQHNLYHYAAWFGILVLFPILLGGLVALLASIPRVRQVAQSVTSAPRHSVVNAWERFLSGAESYQVVITLKNEEKLMGVFQRGMPAPESAEPHDLYFTETSHYDPQATEWKALEQPVGVWVKGSEIKMMEVAPQT